VELMGMTGKMGMTALHGIGWLTRRDDGLRLTDTPDEATITMPSDLTAGRYEVHWCGSAQAAAGFVLGIEQAGGNSVSAWVGEGKTAGAVLLLRAAEEPSTADTLEGAVTLVAHFGIDGQRVGIKWKSTLEDLAKLDRYGGQSVKPVRVYGFDENRVKVRIAYEYWNGTLSDKVKGWDQMTDVVIRDGRTLIVVPLTNYKALDKARGRFLDVALQAISKDGGWYEDDAIVFPVDADGLAEKIKRLPDSFDAIWVQDGLAGAHNRIVETVGHPTSKRIMNALRKGGVILNGADIILTHVSGKQERLTENRIDLMNKASMIMLEGQTGRGTGRWVIAAHDYAYEPPAPLDMAAFKL
jgi:hypothetical protein